MYDDTRISKYPNTLQNRLVEHARLKRESVCDPKEAALTTSQSPIHSLVHSPHSVMSGGGSLEMHGGAAKGQDLVDTLIRIVLCMN